MKQLLLLLLMFCLPPAVLADGMVIPTVAFPAKVTIPDQRALIHFTNGTERLVIETRFTGAGTNFAWVVPFPSQPVIEAATSGLFPTLDYLFRPQITHEVSRDYLAILAVIGLVIVFQIARKRASLLFIFVVALLLTMLMAMMLPTLGAAKSKAMASGSSSQTVDILDRKLVGIFETTTIASRDPAALENWLRENGFVVSSNTGPVIAGYLKDGWCFVAAKIRRDRPESETSTPHPLSFTFKTDKPVYPMRLTGVDNDRLKVELYVFGPARAEAPHFKVERCTQPNYPEPPPDDTWSWNWRRWLPETPDIVHPLLRKWVGGSPVATKLVATLSHSDIQQDVWLGWTAFSEKKNRLFSHSGAWTTGLNYGSWLLAFGLVLLWLAWRIKGNSMPQRTRQISVLVVAAFALSSLTYLWLPKTEVRIVKLHYGHTQEILFELNEYFGDTNAVTKAGVSGQIQGLLANPTNDTMWMNWSGNTPRTRNLENLLLGGRIREDDSPGNFILQTNAEQLEFVGFDEQGAPHIFPEKWDLRSPQ